MGGRVHGWPGRDWRAVRRAAPAAGLLVVFALSVPAQALGLAPSPERAWELVTPPEPVGASVGKVQEISTDGTRVVYTSAGAMPGAPAGDLEPFNLAVRGVGGWGSSPLGVPYSAETVTLSTLFNPVRPVAYDSLLEPVIWLSAEPLTPDAPPEGFGALYRVQPDGTPVLLVEIGEEGQFVAASEDASRVVFFSNAHLLPEDAGRLSGGSIYEVDGSGERLVDVDSEGNLLSACGSNEGAVSVAANLIYFTNPASSGACPELPHVYLRKDGSETIDVSASQCTRPDCNAPAGSTFAGATPDGAAAFFTSVQQLTNDDQDGRRDLYRYDVDSGDLSLVSGEIPEATGVVKQNGAFQVSEDASRVYFAADGKLLPGQGSAGENLYLADGEGLHLVAPGSVLASELQISPDGRFALFGTTAALEAGDTDNRRDVYLWSADTGTATRLSKGTLSDNGGFDAQVSSPLASQAVLFASPTTYRSLTDDGREAFFSTAEQLLPEDSNDAADVYAWSQGELGLISSGSGEDAAEFGGATPDGRTVLFKTAAPLLAADRDGGDRDLYAARVDGGFPPAGESPAGGCGDACRPAPRPRLVRQPPATTGVGAKAAAKRLKLLRVDRHAGVSIARGRPLRVRVRVPAPGRLAGLARMRVGRHSRVAARGVAGAVRAGRALLELRATPAARVRLRRQRVLRVRLVLRQDEQRIRGRLTLRLGRAR